MNRWLMTVALAGASLLMLVPQRSEAQRVFFRGRPGVVYRDGWWGPGWGWGSPYRYYAWGVPAYSSTYYYSPGYYVTPAYSSTYATLVPGETYTYQSTPTYTYEEQAPVYRAETTPSYAYQRKPSYDYEASYPAEAEYQTADRGDIAHVTVHMPSPSADLWFNGTRMPERGTTRTFTTPPLTPGQEYHYTVRARWMQNGRMVESTRTIPVFAGRNAVADFRAGERGVVIEWEVLPPVRPNVERRDVERRIERQPVDVNGRPVDSRAPADLRRPAEVNPPADNIRRPADRTNPADAVRRPADTNPRPQDNLRRPSDTRPAPDVNRPADDIRRPADVNSPADNVRRPADVSRPGETNPRPQDNIRRPSDTRPPQDVSRPADRTPTPARPSTNPKGDGTPQD
jgi:uncharacterized protein (TIGR03000 family)